MTTRRARQDAERRGRTGEFWAALFLRLKFYSILARDYRTPVGEIDLIAKRGRTVAFIEVKRRADLSQGLHAVSRNQRQRIARAAEAFLAGRPEFGTHDYRFDVIIIRPRHLPHHLPHAWMREE